MPDSDNVLVSRMTGGDDRALADLYDRHGRALYAMAWRILGDRDDAEEVVMEAFTQAWRTSGTWTAERGSVAAWLCVLARSRALDRLRARDRQARAVDRASESADQEAAPAMGRPVSGAHQAVEDRERSTHVLAALKGLPEPQRVCIELAYYEGLTQTEIAARLAEPLGTVKTRMRLGMMKLKEMLQPVVAELMA